MFVCPGQRNEYLPFATEKGQQSMSLAILLQKFSGRSISPVLTHLNQRCQVHHIRLLNCSWEKKTHSPIFAATFQTTPRPEACFFRRWLKAHLRFSATSYAAMFGKTILHFFVAQFMVSLLRLSCYFQVRYGRGKAS